MSKIPKQKIQQLFNNNVSRTVDIIFSENKLQQINELYAALQQHKRNNTKTLKQTLENNYDKMLYCSDLLGEVRRYAGAVKEVAARIEGEIGRSNSKDSAPPVSNNPITNIQLLLACKKFHEAMLATTLPATTSASLADRYYLPYLRIEIVTKMQAHMSVNQLTEDRLQECGRCLAEMLYDKEGRLRGEQSGWMDKFKEKSILGIIGRRLERLGAGPASIYEVLFEFKLRNMRDKFRNRCNSYTFEQYFQQLRTILQMIRKQQPNSNAGSIFDELTPQVKSQLASIFIQRRPSGEIVFKCDLYDQLSANPSFEQTVETFHSQLQSQGLEVEHPLTFIKQLWQNYFLNLIDLSLEQANPNTRIVSLKMNSHNPESVPRQLRAYLYDYSLEQSLGIVAEYAGKAGLVGRNVDPIVGRCTGAELELFRGKFVQKIGEIAGSSATWLEGMAGVLGLRKLVLLRLLSDMLFVEIKGMSDRHQLGIEADELLAPFVDVNLHSIWPSFHNDDVSVTQSLLKFDTFFIGYLESLPPALHPPFTSLTRSLTLQVLHHAASLTHGRQKDSIDHTLASLTQGKQKITILQTIMLPYIAQKVFQCEIRPIVIDQNYYGSKFITKESKVLARQAKVQEPIPEGQFEIGDKEDKQQFVKVNIGKSIMNIGNNLLTGLMTKKK